MKSNLQCFFTVHAGHLILPGWNQVTQLSQILAQDNLRNASMYSCLLWTNIPSPDLHSLASWWVTLWIGTIVKKFQQSNTNNKIKWKGKAEKFCLSNDWKLELSDKIQEAGNKELASFFTLLVGLTGWQKKDGNLKMLAAATLWWWANL